MGHLGLAFRILFSSEATRRAGEVLTGSSLTPNTEAPAEPPTPPRSEAITLLAARQRNARFVDCVHKHIAGYSSTQLGAAVRDVHPGCRGVLERIFALAPVVNQLGKTAFEADEPTAAHRHLNGNISRAAGETVTDKLMHSVWKTTRSRLSKGTGTDNDANIMAPTEVQLL